MSIAPTSSLLKEMKSILTQARFKAVSTVNTMMVEAYWLMGKRIVEEEQQGKDRASYGEGLIKQLSKGLSAEFGKGFSVANLKNFRKFYQTFPDIGKGYTLCSKLSWSHYRLIMRVDNAQARHYYIEQSVVQRWSVRSLERNINSGYYQRILSSQDQSTQVTAQDQYQVRGWKGLHHHIAMVFLVILFILEEHLALRTKLQKISCADIINTPRSLLPRRLNDLDDMVRYIECKNDVLC